MARQRASLKCLSMGYVYLSRRATFESTPNPIALALERLQKRGIKPLDLTQSNPTLAGFRYRDDAIRAAVSAPDVMIYQPSPEGAWQARQAIAEYYRERGCPVEPEAVLLVSGTSEGYAYLFKLLGDPGDVVLVPKPSYPLLEYLATLESLELRRYELVFCDRWQIDFDSLEYAIDDRTRAIVIINPNNPTGSYLKRVELVSLLELARARHLVLVVDEVFSDFPLELPPDAVTSVAGLDAGPIIVLSGLSKVAGLPQMKASWLVVGGPNDFRREITGRLAFIADTYLTVGTPVQAGLPVLLELRREFQAQARERLRHNLERLRALAATKSACRLLPVEGGWYAVLQLPPGIDEESWVLALLEEEHVLVHPGYFYDFAGAACIIVSLLCEPAEFEAGLERLGRHLPA